MRSISTWATRRREQRSSIAAAFGLLGDALQPRQFALGDADAGDVGAFMAEQELGIGPALVLFADQVRDRHFDVFEPDFVDLVRAVQRDDRAHGDARRLHVDQQEGDAALRLGFRVGAHQAENPVGVLARACSRSSGR
jgi:hypothetical protein